jgi:hypothetical protein
LNQAGGEHRALAKEIEALTARRQKVSALIEINECAAQMAAASEDR